MQLRTGALSIRTAIPRKGRIPRYEDQIIESSQQFFYRFQRDGPEARDNQRLRECLERQFLGITPDLEIRLRPELLTEQDGPMLEHGLRAFERARLNEPRDPADKPDRALLEQRWKKFAA